MMRSVSTAATQSPGTDEVNTSRPDHELSTSTPLKNTFNYYSYLSSHYSFDSDLGNKMNQTIRLISIPSIIYGQSIKKGSVELNFYVTGSHLNSNFGKTIIKAKKDNVV